MDYQAAIASLKTADPTLATVIERVGDCTLHQEQSTGDLFEALAESILYQQLSGKAAATIHRRFLALFPDQPHPTPQDLLNTPDEVLRSAGVSRSKALYLKDLSQKFLDGLPDLAALEAMDDEAIIRSLISVKGIGRWTVQMLLIFRMHRWDVLPTEDLGIRNGFQKAYNLTELPNKKTMEAIAHPWQPYRTIGSWYLWRNLDRAV